MRRHRRAVRHGHRPVGHVWDGVLCGTDAFQALAATSTGYRLERIDGTTIIAAGVEGIAIGPGAPSAFIEFVYVPA